MRSISACVAALAVSLCAARAPADVSDFEGSFFGGEVAYNTNGVDVFSFGQTLEFRSNALADDLLTDVPSPQDPSQVWSVESQVTAGGPVGGHGRPEHTGSLIFHFWRPRATEIAAQYPVYLNLFGLDAQSATPYQVIGSAVYVSFLPQQSDNPWDGIELPEGDGSENNTFLQYTANGLGVELQVTPADYGIPPDDEISEFYVGFTVQAIPEPATMLLLAGGVAVFCRRRLRR